MPIASLSSGCLVDIMAGVEFDKPVLQILGSKQIKSTENSERYRLLVSDGKYLNSFAMLATQLNEFVSDGRLSDNTIVRIDRYITSMVNKSEPGQTKRVLIILGLTVLNTGAEVKEKVGTPVQIESATKPDPNPTAAPPQPAAASNAYGSNANFSNNGPSSSMMSTSIIGDHLTHPISSLSPYQNKWVIKARVTSKSAVRQWNNAKGEGKLFSMDLMDESGEMRATAFKAECDRFYEMIQVDKVYLITKGVLKPANKQYTTIKNDYEMTFNGETHIEECKDDHGNVPTVQYNFVPIAQLANLDPQATVDIIGVCRDVGDLMQFTAKASGRELKKKEITLVDSSNSAISLTLWGSEAEQFDGSLQPIILVKNGRINEFGGGKTLSMGSGSTMKVNPDIVEGHKLRGWFDNGGGNNISGSISARTGSGGFNTEWMDFMDVKAKNLGNGEKPDYFMSKAVVNIVKSVNSFYKSCPTPDCNKKVLDQDNGTFRCEKCNSDFSSFKYRLLLQMSIGDWSSNRWVTCFSDLAEVLLKKPAQEVGEALDHNKDLADTILASITFKSYVFKLRTKVEFFGDSARNKITVVAADPIKYKEYNKYLIKNLQEFTGINRI